MVVDSPLNSQTTECTECRYTDQPADFVLFLSTRPPFIKNTNYVTGKNPLRFVLVSVTLISYAFRFRVGQFFCFVDFEKELCIQVAVASYID